MLHERSEDDMSLIQASLIFNARSLYEHKPFDLQTGPPLFLSILRPKIDGRKNILL